MKTILVTSKKFGDTESFVSDEDFELVSKFKWSLKVYPGGTKYPRCNIWIDGKRCSIFMHKLLWPQFNIVDHINGNGLDNTRENIREATKQQNNRNAKKRVDGYSSKYKGVCNFNKPRHKKKWIAQIGFNYKIIYLGSFYTEKEAALAYNEAAIKYFGEFAWLNSIE